jgi:hypothetical protein
METMVLLVVVALAGAGALVAVVLCALQQAEHRARGLLPGPDPRGTTSALLDAVLGAVPIRRVRHDGLSFEDGSGILLAGADRDALRRLVGLAAVREVVLERVYQLTGGLRLVFRGGDRRLFLDVGGVHLVTAAD